MRIDVGEEFGYAILVMAGHEVRVDLWQSHDRVLTIYAKAREERESGKECNPLAELVQYLQELGYPPVSYGLADRWALKVLETVKALRGNFEASAPSPEQPRPSSQGSTESTPSD
jgi:hypothetical protein